MYFYSSFPSTGEIGSFEQQIIKRSFEEKYKYNLTSKINAYTGVLEDKENWEEIAIGNKRTIEKFNHTYNDLSTYFKYVMLKLSDQYHYNCSHRVYAHKVLIPFIKMVQQFMEDLIIPLDFFMQRIASDKLKDDPRLSKINRMINILKWRINDLKYLSSQH